MRLPGTRESTPALVSELVQTVRPRARHQFQRDGVGGRTGIEQHRAVFRHELQGGPRNRCLALGVLGFALRERRLHHAATGGAAVHHVEVALVSEQLQIAPDGLMRDAECLGQLAHADRSDRAQAAHDLVMAANGERTRH